MTAQSATAGVDGSVHRGGRDGDRLHPAAWWLWALGLATAASRVSNPLVLAMIAAVAGYVVAARRGPDPWAGAYRIFLIVGMCAIGVRLCFHLIFGGGDGSTVLFTLPSVRLPEWAQGFRLGGAVTAEGAAAALYDGMRLATLLMCVGAANALASPKRLIRSMPAALYEVSVAVVVALSMAPQLVASAARVNRARALRGDTRRGPAHLLRSVVAPVLHDALDRSLALAAAMESRGYGRSAAVPKARRRVTGALLLAGLLGMCVGVYGLLGAQTSTPTAMALLAGGTVVGLFGMVVASARVRRTRYRPDPFRAREWLVSVSGCAVAVSVVVCEQTAPAVLLPSTNPLTPPTMPLIVAAGCAVALLPSVVAPRPPRFADARRGAA